MPTNSFIPTEEMVKKWYANYTEKEVKEVIQNYSNSVGFNMTKGDLGTTQIVKGRGLNYCDICKKDIGGGMISVGKSNLNRLCPRCAKTYLSKFISKLKDYQEVVQERLKEVEKLDLDKWDEENKTKCMLEKLKNG